MNTYPGIITNADALATTPLRRDALAVIEAGIAAAHPRTVLPHGVRLRGFALVIGNDRYDLTAGRVLVIGGGKAAGAMAEVLETIVGPDRITGGVVNALPGPWATQCIRLHPSTHPTPGRAGVAGVDRMLALTADLMPNDLVLCLISGGASAMMAAPAAGISLRDKQRLTELLLRSGASIAEINTVRRHLSRVKGGRLAQHLFPARVATLIISDHIGGQLEVIGSGPTSPDPTTFADAAGVLRHYNLWDRMPHAIRNLMAAGLAGVVSDTPKAGDPCFAGGRHYVLANTATAVAGMRQAARTRGFGAVSVLSDQVAGEASEAARVLGPVLRYAYLQLPAGGTQAIVWGGELTVTLGRAAGAGGRCQEFGAALIPELAGLDGCVVAAVGSDGADFAPGLGGALVDGATLSHAQAAGVDVAAALARHNTTPLHRTLGSLVQTNPSGTNVCDLFVCLIRKPA